MKRDCYAAEYDPNFVQNLLKFVDNFQIKASLVRVLALQAVQSAILFALKMNLCFAICIRRPVSRVLSPPGSLNQGWSDNSSRSAVASATHATDPER